MWVEVENVVAKITGSIEGGPIVGKSQYQRRDASRKIVGFIVNFQPKFDIILQAVTLKKDGEVANVGLSSIRHYDLDVWNLPEVKGLVADIKAMIEIGFPLDEFLTPRPTLTDR